MLHAREELRRGPRPTDHPADLCTDAAGYVPVRAGCRLTGNARVERHAGRLVDLVLAGEQVDVRALVTVRHRHRSGADRPVHLRDADELALRAAHDDVLHRRPLRQPSRRRGGRSPRRPRPGSRAASSGGAPVDAARARAGPAWLQRSELVDEHLRREPPATEPVDDDRSTHGAGSSWGFSTHPVATSSSNEQRAPEMACSSIASSAALARLVSARSCPSRRPSSARTHHVERRSPTGFDDRAACAARRHAG